MNKFKRYLRIFILLFIGAILFMGVWAFQLNMDIQERLEKGWFQPPLEIYSGGEQLIAGQKMAPAELASFLSNHRYRERYEGQDLYPNDYTVLDSSQCSEVNGDSFESGYDTCIFFRMQDKTYLVGFRDDHIDTIFLSTSTSRHSGGFKMTDRMNFESTLFAQYYEGAPILRKVIRIGDVPIECLHAVMAIEDNQFLDHPGVSFKGLLRALVRNLVERRYAQGGSTITQQLVRNYFLTLEKTLKRKIVELMMSILLEANLEKDEILENYLNVIYMGQNGPFQVKGFGAAAEFYMQTGISELKLDQCALLAAIINSPGRYNPFVNPENALARRGLVLDKMVEFNLISQDQAKTAKEKPLPKPVKAGMSEPAPYFTQVIFRELERLGIEKEEGLKIFTSLDIAAQEAAQTEVLKHVQALEKDNKKIKEIAEKKKNHLEAALISIDISSGEVIALVGGRQYKKTQYNRILDAHRQVGSIMKPFVYLTALENRTPDGSERNPLTPVFDIPFVHSYEGQKWSPRNYTKDHYGQIPLYFALKNSLNISTAKLGLEVGLQNIIEVARRAGITSPLEPFPSLTLGAFEIYPMEIATAYLTLARFGNRIPISFIRSVQDGHGKVLYEKSISETQEFFAQKVAVLVGMMKETLRSGTARVSKVWGFQKPAAGKTGTTSDTKDAWFAGFTPQILTITWVGYDNNEVSGLTGASGALPLWVKFMNQATARYGAEDFQWPEGVEKKSYSRDELIRQIEKYDGEADVVDTEFIFED